MAKKLLDLDGLRYFYGKILARMGNLSNPALNQNPDFQIWQRGTSFGDIFQQYSADRWYCTKTSGTHSFEKVQNGIKITTNGVTYISQFIENSLKLKNKKLTATISINEKLYHVTGVPIENPVIDIENGRMQIQWGEGRQVVNLLIRVNAGVSIINYAKLELGEIATPLSPRPYGEELALCQRYYEKSYDVSPTDDRGEIMYKPYSTSANGMFGGNFKVTKRIIPTIKIYAPGTGTLGKVRDVDSNVDKVCGIYAASKDILGWVDVGIVVAGNRLAWHYEVDAEIY